VVRLDDLFAHLKSLHELVRQLDVLRAVARPNIARGSAGNDRAHGLGFAAAFAIATAVRESGDADRDGLDTLAQRIAADHGRKVKLFTQDLKSPPHYLRRARHRGPVRAQRRRA
jgi:hypothetical protein